jgi:cyclase
MSTQRVIPVLLLRGQGLVKTVEFKNPTYVGDPRNAVKIFSERMVDELVLLDIDATPENRRPRFDFVEEIVSEAFMPVAYGGGIRTTEDAHRMVSLGVEKVVINTRAIQHPTFIHELADSLGSQSVVVSLDVKRDRLGRYRLCTHSGRVATRLSPTTFASEAERLGAGEVLINSIDRDGTMTGYDIPLVRSIADNLSVPLIACGGAGSLSDVRAVLDRGGASAAAAGSLFVFQGKHRSVLINYPDQVETQGMSVR